MRNFFFLMTFFLSITGFAEKPICDREMATFIIEQGIMESAANDCQGDGIDLKTYHEAYRHFMSIVWAAQKSCSNKFSYEDIGYMSQKVKMIAQDCVNPAVPSQGATYTCTDGTVSVRAFVDGYQGETGSYESPTDLFNNKHRVEIDYNGRTFIYDKMIISYFDGAGQDVFQALYPDNLSGLSNLVNFYFEHEGWYLVGGFQIPVVYGQDIPPYDYEFEEWYGFDGESMKCEENQDW